MTEIGTFSYRKKSRLLHPDKMRNPSKEATDRFARLGVIANILRGPEKERYDFFLQKGFPKWKGTGYYYAVCISFIFFLTTAA